jgi:hypothetical protein
MAEEQQEVDFAFVYRLQVVDRKEVVEVNHQRELAKQLPRGYDPHQQIDLGGLEVHHAPLDQ